MGKTFSPITLDRAVAACQWTPRGASQDLGDGPGGAGVVFNDLPGDAVQAVAEETTATGGQAMVSAGDIGDWDTASSWSRPR